MIEQKVSKYIQRHQLIKHDGRYIVALSGGADSVALLLIMDALGFNISAAHCNFHLRGKESDRDELFCVHLCQKRGIPLSRIHFDTNEYAQLHKVSIEMAARELRYRYFAQLARDLGADGICVAHHRDDNVETLLLNLLRGSGIDGLAGIAPKNGNILRPLLCVSRADILQYLKEQSQDYVTDSTNLEDDALRNKIRHHVIPLLQSLNPAASDNIALSAKYVRQACDMLSAMDSNQAEDALVKDNQMEDNQTEDGKIKDDKAKALRINEVNVNNSNMDGPIYINKVKVMQAASPEFMLHKQAGKYGFHGECIDGIIESLKSVDGGVGKVWKSNDHLLTIDREQLIIIPQHQIETCERERGFHIPEEGNYRIGSPEQSYHANNGTQNGIHTIAAVKISIKRYARGADFQPSREPHRITLDADKVSFPLIYRRTQAGDRFTPFGMKGSKLVSDYLTDRKRNLIDKMQQHVLTDRKGEIIWLIGERTSDKVKITPETKNVLEIILE